MKVMQLLPELNSGGVERGTLEIARALVAQSHQSLVVSNGGRLVSQLEAEGSTHLTLPIHKNHCQACGKSVHYVSLLKNTNQTLYMCALAYLRG